MHRLLKLKMPVQQCLLFGTDKYMSESQELWGTPKNIHIHYWCILNVWGQNNSQSLLCRDLQSLLWHIAGFHWWPCPHSNTCSDHGNSGSLQVCWWHTPMSCYMDQTTHVCDTSSGFYRLCIHRHIYSGHSDKGSFQLHQCNHYQKNMDHQSFLQLNISSSKSLFMT